MQKPLDSDRPVTAAFWIRSAAVFGVLFQYDLLAKDLTDTSVAVTALLIALFAGWMLSFKNIKGTAAVPALLLAPFAARLLLALPRWFSGSLETNIALDSLLLNYDRNNFVFCLPFYYAAITAFFTARSRGRLRVCALLDCVLIMLTFCIARSTDMRFYSLPITLLAVFGILLTMELSVIVLSIPKDAFMSRRETGLSFALLLCFLLAGSVLLMFEAQKEDFNNPGADGSSGTVPAGNGLIKPGLFSFDMTPFLNLNTEVSMGDELVLIVRKEKNDNHILMRRFVLSAYNSVKTGNVDAGFTRHDTIDEKNQRREVPAGKLAFSDADYLRRETLKQEYYIKNIDGASFLAMNEPVMATPFENYNESSFKSVYEVESRVSNASPYELFTAAQDYQNDPYFGLSQEEFLWYTAFANAKSGITATEQKIKELAESLTAEYTDNFSKMFVLLDYFTHGDFRYSLKPGIAADGDQLHHFLFVSKRGYCSYFALAFASMLRSLEIPSRVAVGFYLDQETEYFGFYPIRSGNAHAWVEVFFPEYGWIEFDPTTELYAEDELEPSLGGGGNFEQLMREILENRGKLKPKSTIAEDADENVFAQVIQRIVQKTKKLLLPVLIFTVGIAVILLRLRYYLLSLIRKNPRTKTIMLWRHILTILRLKGIKIYDKNTQLSEAQWVSTLPCASLLTPLYEALSRARYAPDWTQEDAAAFFRAYKLFRQKFKMTRKNRTIMPLFIMFFALLLIQQPAVPQEFFEDSNALIDAAFEAEQDEYWERAVSLYNQGKKIYPDDWRFPVSLGDLYLRKMLYRLAKDEYLAAYNLIPDYLDLIYKLAFVSGSLNENAEAAMYFERYLEYDPEAIDIIAELGWVYFKLHRLAEGEALLLTAMQNHGITRRPAMTLATIYSDMLNYEDSSRWYTTAINAARTAEYQYRSSDFAATAYYNYAILESRFYNYETAFELAQKSLEMADRDTGHMMRGELYLRCFDFTRSYSEYSRAFEMDKQSPLPKVSLAQVYLITGKLEEARRYAEDCLKATNHAWMFRFGIDPDQYARDLHEILYKTYLGLYNKTQFTVYGSLKDRFDATLQRIQYRFKYAVHKRLYEKYSLLTAHSYNMAEQGGQYLEALLQYNNAFQNYKNRALYYLRLAMEYETGIIPRSEAAYLYETGKLEKNRAKLETALENFDGIWERDKSADTYIELYHTAKNSGHYNKARESAEWLYLLNPGALRQNEIRLPVALNISGGTKAQQRKIRGILIKSGFEALEPGTYPCRFALEFTIAESTIQLELKNRISGSLLLRGSLTMPEWSAKQRASFAGTVADTVFEVR